MYCKPQQGGGEGAELGSRIEESFHFITGITQVILMRMIMMVMMIRMISALVANIKYDEESLAL